MLKIWWFTIRPKTLTASLLPLSLSLFLCYDYSIYKNLSFSWINAALVSIGVFSLQILVNLLNDYYDVQKGSDEKKETARGLQTGKITLKQVKRVCLLLACFIFLIILYFSIKKSLIILLLGVLSLFFAYAYTGGPFPLAYRGLGDVFVFIFFGPLATFGISFCLLGYAFVLKDPSPFFLIGVTSGSLGVCLLIVNNIRDIEEDKKHGKYTLAVILGASLSKVQYLFFLLLAYGSYLSYSTAYYFDGILPLFALTQGFFAFYLLLKLKGNQLNVVLAQTSLNMLFFCLFLVISNAL